MADGLSGTGLIGGAAESMCRAGILGKSYACGLGQSGSNFTEWLLCIMGFVGFRDGQGEGIHSLAGDMGVGTNEKPDAGCACSDLSKWTWG